MITLYWFSRERGQLNQANMHEFSTRSIAWGGAWEDGVRQVLQETIARGDGLLQPPPGEKPGVLILERNRRSAPPGAVGRG